VSSRHILVQTKGGLENEKARVDSEGEARVDGWGRVYRGQLRGNRFCSARPGADDFPGGFHHGIITFAGGQPVYTNPHAPGACVPGSGGVLVGAIGVSGDGVDEDDDVATKAVTNAGFCLKP